MPAKWVNNEYISFHKHAYFIPISFIPIYMQTWNFHAVQLTKNITFYLYITERYAREVSE